MAVWETEDESNGPASHSLPTPQDTPYRTPSNASRRSRRSITPPGMQTSPPLPAVDRGGKASKRSSKDVSNDDTISVLDPRRFTPTLHANLVAEILNLRRDQEDKIKLIENLEASLHATRGEQEALQETATVTAKETRSLKRQLALLEGGSSSAIGELARERDEAVESATELKKRLDVAQRKIRTQEDDSQRVHDLWTRDKDAWDEEKRKYERKIHIAETRMKVVLDEVAAYQNAHTNGNGAESEAEGDWSMHRRNQSIESLKRPGSVARGKLWVNQTVLEALEDGIQEDEDEEEAPPAPKLAYKDTGGQFSPPPSPTLEVFKPATPEPLTQVERPPEGDSQRCRLSGITSIVTVASKSIVFRLRDPIDQRLARLPLHLHPDTISSRPPSPNPAAPANAGDPSLVQFTPAPNNLPPRNPRRLTSRRSIGDVPPSPPLPAPPISPTFSGGLSNGLENTHNDAYPGNNDDGPLSSQKAPMRRPHRISSLFAGFDANSSDEADDFGDGDLSDPEFQTALSHPGQRPKSSAVKPSKRRSSGTATSPEHDSMRYHSAPRSSAKPLGTESYSYSLQSKETVNKDKDPGSRTSVQMGAQRSVEKSIAGPSSKPNGMRRAALIQSGIASHQGRSRSPSLPDSQDPPFPIPTRASSRRPPFSVSAPSDGQRSPTRGEGGWHRRGSSRTHYRANSIRKVRSAAALPRTQRNRRQSRSPPPFSETTEVPESPSLPPLPHNDITSMSHREPSRSRFRSSHRSQPSTNTAQTSQTYQTNQTNLTDLNSIGGGSPTTGVVDAIAQTMVGEWMFKYVRRRKSFGVPETNGKDDNSNDRHKRWVWLAPYERAILWSSKQPNSGSALMGKAGRKLTIQSVLDVKDDNPTPKGGATLFNRSILILTPQRALKFTAVSADRHYIWLTALSFLAHSQQAVPEIITAPPPPKTVLPDFEMPQPKRKTGIRDSIRLTKSKAPSFRQPPVPSIPGSLPSAPSSQVGDVSSSRQTETFPPLPMSSHHQREQSSDAAEPPFIPRFHERSSQAMVHGSPPTSEASSRPNNFFHALGTVRMEAFIHPLAFSGGFDGDPDENDEFRYRARGRSKEIVAGRAGAGIANARIPEARVVRMITMAGVRRREKRTFSAMIESTEFSFFFSSSLGMKELSLGCQHQMHMHVSSL
ncbi:conserved hypothetical protein [Verticillium alfalfae VaMs.102]|uniref:Pleckstrin homology domain-containing protein n=1 Tax=Verticillium alfalfae (strain VaMs.102 / ATCC MYA-4576 / FGSC 10136) TaxID=526221 RepID=C9S5D0_VERA1|nr:conserved hypothetical protein [Verticillium alfalfae VaMs.102]EEY14202.1 conserved hypothetical protein [Verticillium alfalfae VaMs.102]